MISAYDSTIASGWTWETAVFAGVMVFGPLILIAAGFVALLRRSIPHTKSQRFIGLFALTGTLTSFAAWSLMPMIGRQVETHLVVTSQYFGPLCVWVAILSVVAGWWAHRRIFVINALAGIWIVVLWFTIGFTPFG